MTDSTELADQAEPDSVPRPGWRRRRLMSRVSIQSKLLMMLLLTSVLSAAVVGAIGFHSGRQSLEASALDRLTQSRGAQVRQLQTQLTDLKNTLIVYTHGATAGDALRSFTAGFDQLADATIDPAQERAIRGYYQDHIAKREEEQTSEQVQIDSLLPTSNAEKYLQAHYTAPFPNRKTAINVDNTGDGSAWTAANIRYNDFFRTIVTRSQFEDALLLDAAGNVVYSAYKNVDLGTNTVTGPYRESELTKAFQTAMQSRTVDYIGVTDFGYYEPTGTPTAWLTAPIDAQGQRVGVLALEFPIVKINQLMTVKQKWEAAGLGHTGETFLVGPDNLMRSDSRLFLQDPEAYKREAVAAGTAPYVAEQAIRQHGTTLVQPIAADTTRLAAQDQSGSLLHRDYLGHRTLQSYAPVSLTGLEWIVVAKIDAAEAFAPVRAFTRTLVLSTAVIIFVVCIAAMLLAQIFVRPLRELKAGARMISSGDYDVSLPVLSHDELGDLTVAFNDMSRNLTIKEELLNEQRKENDRLLLTVMPEAVVQRYRQGEETISLEHQDLTVIVAGTDGLDELSAGLSSEESLSIVNTLVRQFDAAAENLGVEPVRTLHNWYMASCGLSVPRLDSVRRTIDFAAEMQRIVDRFNSETGNSLRLRAGIDTGTVTSGLVGRSSLAYDMWGSAVNLAHHVHGESSQPGVYVTSRVHDAMRDSLQFTAAGSVTVDGAKESIWCLAEHQQ